jgi:hypothetical protein
MLEEAVEELGSGKRDMADLAGTVIPIAEGDLLVVDAFDAAVGDGHTEQISAQIGENGLAGAGGLAMDDPGGLPDFGWDLFQ